MKIFRISKFINNERGNVAVLVALSFMGLLAIAGLAIDGGLLYMTKTHLQKTANAAVLSGAQELTNNEEKVRVIVNDILKAHKEETTINNLHVELENRVAVSLVKPVKLSFARIFGFDKVNVKVRSAAELRPIGRAAGAAPLGIDERTPLEYLKPYKLKVDSSDSVSGYFGILALGGPGARTYEENLQYGYQEELKIGMVIDTQTGNIAGKTRTVVQELVNGCPESPRDVFDRDCSRVILVPVYKPYQFDSNQLKSVEITGFAYFYITDPMSATDTSITGMFIKRTGTGYEENGSITRGAYKIRITE
jgi:hypothetical protein